MIRIRKPEAPTVLVTRGAAQTAQDRADYALHSAEYNNGARKFAAKSSIYAHDEVKNALTLAQHKKCAFCESRFTHISYGDVEHFRPKGGYCQTEGESLSKPGYYWLAYEWTNLFVSCTLCNQQFKKNLFPLRREHLRARSHNDDIAREEPLLIDPAAQDPEEFISFRKEVPYAINDNPYGRATIQVLGLNRLELNEERSRRLELLAALSNAIFILRSKQEKISDFVEVLEDIRKLEAKLEAETRPTADYSSAVKAAIRANFSGPGWDR